MHKNIELLAPAGSFEALQAAVQNGCDAVYLGGTMFGARAYANNFNHEEMQKAVAYAHIYGVRVYVTVNTLIYENEVDSFLRYIKELQDADVDALILQDIGLFSLVHKYFPDFELHASTQMHIHNPMGIKMLKEMGAARVVVPRETTIEEIEEYAKLGIGLEVFVQGALCVSYSGQCLMSSLTLGRSGNRGECAQPCRMQYTLEENHHGLHKEIKAEGKYLLSPKDLNTLKQVPSLLDAGIASFKIEGRMKRPEYVALMTSLYRKAIDAYKEKRDFHVEKAMIDEMQKIFNRGFTSGHLFHQIGSSLMNPIRPNHIGIKAGIIEHISKDRFTVKLLEDLHQGDGVRILNEQNDEGFRINRMYQNGLLVNGAKKGEYVQLDKTGYIKKGSTLLKTSDVKQLEELKKSYQSQIRYEPIKASFRMEIGEEAIFIVEDDAHHRVIEKSTMMCETALKTPLSKDRIKTQLQKTKDTPFIIQTLCLDEVCETGIIPIKEVNRMRREALEKLVELRKVRNKHRRIIEYNKETLVCEPRKELIIIVHTEEQFECCKEMENSLIYVADENVYRKLKARGENVFLREPRIKKDEYKYENVMIQENGGFAKNMHGISDTSLNITNSYSAKFAFDHGVQIVTLSLEHTLESINDLTKTFEEHYHTKGNFAYQIYGYTELMISEYCPIQMCLKDDGKKNCGLCRRGIRYDLKDLKGHRYPILTDQSCRMHLLSEKPMNHIEDWKEYASAGITSPYIVFTIEDKFETKQVLAQVKEIYNEV